MMRETQNEPLVTLDKYLSQVIVVEKPSGVKELVASLEFKGVETKFVCLWIETVCVENKDGVCLHEKFCSQKGRVASLKLKEETGEL